MGNKQANAITSSQPAGHQNEQKNTERLKQSQSQSRRNPTSKPAGPNEQELYNQMNAERLGNYIQRDGNTGELSGESSQHVVKKISLLIHPPFDISTDDESSITHLLGYRSPDNIKSIIPVTRGRGAFMHINFTYRQLQDILRQYILNEIEYHKIHEILTNKSNVRLGYVKGIRDFVDWLYPYEEVRLGVFNIEKLKTLIFTDKWKTFKINVIGEEINISTLNKAFQALTQFLKGATSKEKTTIRSEDGTEAIEFKNKFSQTVKELLNEVVHQYISEKNEPGEIAASIQGGGARHVQAWKRAILIHERLTSQRNVSERRALNRALRGMAAPS